MKNTYLMGGRSNTALARMRDFIGKHPPDFQISARCCDYCKKQVAHQVQKGYDMIITGERRAEGGRK